MGAERALHQAIAAAVEAWPKGAQPAAQVRERERERERERGEQLVVSQSTAGSGSG